jgi:hypothetical protein
MPKLGDFVENPDSTFGQLQELLKTMDIPLNRFGDLRWLARNIGINNSNHPNLDKAVALIKKLSS